LSKGCPFPTAGDVIECEDAGVFFALLCSVAEWETKQSFLEQMNPMFSPGAAGVESLIFGGIQAILVRLPRNVWESA
jgi:hypothetical protein